METVGRYTTNMIEAAPSPADPLRLCSSCSCLRRRRRRRRQRFEGTTASLSPPQKTPNNEMDEISNPFCGPSNWREILPAVSRRQHSQNVREAENTQQSFIETHNDSISSHHDHRNEHKQQNNERCSRNFSHKPTTSSPLLSGSSVVDCQSANWHQLDGGIITHEISWQQRKRQAQFGRVQESHSGHRRPLARRKARSAPWSIDLRYILTLFALSCLLVSCSAVSAQNETGRIEEDFYSALSERQQQHQANIPLSAVRGATDKPKGRATVQQPAAGAEKENTAAARAVRAATSGGRAGLAAVPLMSESELLPFSEFIVQPPTFSDLMKSWPPTTLRAVASSLASAADSQTNRQRQQQQQQRQSPIATPPLSYLKTHQQQQQQQRETSGEQDLQSLLSRNHLNEDLDDTIVTADQSFERELAPEPETWINYLGDLGDYIYLQLKHHLERASTNRLSSTGSGREDSSSDSLAAATAVATAEVGQKQQPQQRKGPLKMETIDELLDDYYYDQYENSQVLYYGAQLVREHEAFEIGCFLPIDQQAEWTKSGRPLPPDGQASPRSIRRNLFLNAKQNYSLRVFTASLSDSGNYRCSKMSRKFHKLIVVPDGASPNQVHAIQQRLLSVVAPAKQSAADSRIYQFKRTLRGSLRLAAALGSSGSSANQLVAGYLIVENEPLVVNCNISDIFVLQRLRENPQFRLAWYKNGKQLPSSKLASGLAMPSSSNQHHLQQQQQQQQRAQIASSKQLQLAYGQQQQQQQQARLQFLDLNGRKLFISSAQYSDAGEYLCSWSNLPARQMSAPDLSDDESGSAELLATNGNNNNDQLVASAQPASNDQLEPLSRNPLAAGSLSQLIVPVKLRPFRSTYHVRRGHQLRLVCQLQRGYPQAQLNWYIGNRLVDADFLKEHAGQYKLLHLRNQNQLSAFGSLAADSDRPTGEQAAAAEGSGGAASANRPKIVEVNPIPMGKLQMQLSQDGRSWIEYRELDDEKAAIDTSEHQLRYMQLKFARLTGVNVSAGSNLSGQQRSVDSDTLATLGQMSISVLVIESLDIERDTMRYACRATNRANTDEVTTVIRVQASSTITSRPSSGRATLIPGQNLNFQCDTDREVDGAQFWWYRTLVGGEDERLIEPNDDEHIEIHNNRLTLKNPTFDLVGDYTCKQLYLNEYSKVHQPNKSEFAVIRVRTQPIIEDFGIDTSHTGSSSTVKDGDRLELTCTVYDKVTPVNITWLRSMTSDDVRKMVPLREADLEVTTTTDSMPRRRNKHEKEFSIYYPTHFVSRSQHGIEIQSVGPFSKKLIIDPVSPEHRSYYACVADNGITERTKRIIFIRVKDRLIALWPFLGILAEFFILFTIIKIWETQRFNFTYGAGSAPAGAGSRALLAGPSKGPNSR